MSVGVAERSGAVEARAAELEGVLRRLLEEHEALRTLAARRVEAMRRADTGALGACLTEESARVRRVAELEAERLGVVKAMAEAMGGPSGPRTPVRWFCERLGGPVRERLEGVSKELRGCIEALRRENDAARDAAGMLAAHMEGLMRQAAATLNKARTYGRMGAVEPAGGAASLVDTTT